MVRDPDDGPTERGVADAGRLLAPLAAVLGAGLVSSRPARWGDARATWHVDLDDGRRVVARLIADADVVAVQRHAALVSAVGAAGIPVPGVMTATTDAGSWLITDHVGGGVGAAWLDDADRARVLGRTMGRLQRGLRDLDPRSVGSLTQGPPDHAMDHEEDGIAAALTEADAIIADRAGAMAFVHGDFAPVNVILDGSGNLRALVDFEHAHIGDALEDVAWWGWVVRHHHPAAWMAAWGTFCASAGVDPTHEGATLRAWMLRQLARRAASAPDRAGRDRWLARLAEAVTW